MNYVIYLGGLSVTPAADSTTFLPAICFLEPYLTHIIRQSPACDEGV
jgi:hypothetical protein